MKQQRHTFRLEKTAHHEAGHAVVSVHFDLPFTWVTIDPGKGFWGRIRNYNLHMLSGHEDGRLLRRMVRESIVVCYAGIEAEKLFDPKADERYAQDDLSQAWNLPREHQISIRGSGYVGDEVYEAYLERARKEARLLLMKRWSDVTLVVRSLLEKKTLTEPDVRKAMQG